VHGALGNALAILVRELFQQVEVLHEHWAEGPRRDAVLVVGDRYSANRCECRLLGQKIAPACCEAVRLRLPYRIDNEPQGARNDFIAAVR